MRYFVIKKSKITLILNVILSVFVIVTLVLSSGVEAVMLNTQYNPITDIDVQENKIALTLNAYKNTDTDAWLEELGEIKATFFVSEEFEIAHPEKIKNIISKGHSVGILEDSLQNKTRNEINDRLAARIECLARLTGKNADLIRFNHNSYDDNVIKAVFELGLFPVQWSTDDTSENFSKGDIILVTGESNIGEFLKKIAADGFETSTVDGIILRSN